MKKISKIILTLVLISLVLAAATPVLAQIDQPYYPGGIPKFLIKDPQTGEEGAIVKISKAILYIVATIAVLFLIIGGFQYITSAGNPDAIEKAKSTILYAIIGVIACLLAYAVVKYIIGKF